jgi:hypothetical protein
MVSSTFAGFHRLNSMLAEQHDRSLYAAIQMIECMILHANHVIIMSTFAAIPILVRRQTARRKQWCRII